MATKILSSDINLRASERMTDDPDGGGEMTTIIANNKINELFPPISESDRLAGRISIQQGYLHIATNTNDTYRGANVIVDLPPSDPAVSIILFDIGVQGGSRADAQLHVESYVSMGPRSRLQPVGTQNAGQGQILLYQSLGYPLPDIGDVYFLSNEITGDQQAFKITNIESYSQVFVNATQEWTANVLLVTISQPLEITFGGAEPWKNFPGDTWVRSSLVQQSSNYAGISPVTANVTTGDLEVSVDSILSQIIPVTNSEIPVLDAPLSSSIVSVDAGSHTLDVVNYAHNYAIPITLANKGLNYSANLRPLPSRASTVVSYRAYGKWYTLSCDANGDITGADASYGSGKLLETGTLTVTLGAEPDIGSSVIISWGSDVHYLKRLDIGVVKQRFDFNFSEAVKPASLEIDYTISTVVITATTDAAGIITGTYVTGYVDNNTGEGWIDFTTWPDDATSLAVRYDHTGTFTESFANAGPGAEAFALTNFPVEPGSVSVYIPAERADYPNSSVLIRELSDAGNGNLIHNYTIEGTIDYTLGTGTIQQAWEELVRVYGSRWGSYGWSDILTATKATAGANFNITYTTVSGTATARTTTENIEILTIVFGGELTDTLVPGALRFQWNGVEYRDLGNGFIGRSAIPWNDTGSVTAGSINYATKTVYLTNFVRGAGALTVVSCLTQYGEWPSIDVYARTQGSPLRYGSFQIRVTAVDGTELLGASDQNGDVNEAFIQGTIQQDVGVFDLHFGDLVLDSSLTVDEKLDLWYNVDNIINYSLPDASKTAWWYTRWPSGYDGYIWRPLEVFNSTIKINAVIIAVLPLSPNELGLDPVRLPNTGKVPIFQAGSRVVIHNTQSVTLANPAVAGSTIDCGRTRLSRVRLVDALGRRVPDDRIYPGQYVLYSGLTPLQQAAYAWWEIRDDGTVWFPSTTDLDAGLVELSTPLDLTGYDQPLKLEHTIEDSLLATGVDLSGLITVNKQISHDYPANTSYLSSQLYKNDMHARYTNLFSQTTWTVWSDELIGSTTAAQYNDVLYPFIVTNNGVIDERWRITFTSTTAFNVYGERSGLIATGTTATDLQPTNPATGSAYFFIDYRGWGTGWAAGNTVRFNTVWPGSIWFARCVLASEATGNADSVSVVFRGDSDPA